VCSNPRIFLQNNTPNLGSKVKAHTPGLLSATTTTTLLSTQKKNTATMSSEKASNGKDKLEGM
jgi:hypothetical protein